MSREACLLSGSFAESGSSLQALLTVPKQPGNKLTLANTGHLLGGQCLFRATGDTSGPVPIFDGLVTLLATNTNRLDTSFPFPTMELGMDLLGMIFEHRASLLFLLSLPIFFPSPG